MRYIYTTIFLFMCMISSYGQRTVYVCTGSGAYKYHYDIECRGLNNCTADIKEIREEKAISNPKYIGLCKLCGKSKATDTPLKTAGASYNGENSKSGNPQLSHGQQNDSKKQASGPQKKSKLGTYEKYKGQTK